MEDVVRFGPGVNLRGYGHYKETYEKVDGRWLFTSSTLTRLREDVFNGVAAVYISDRLRRVMGKVSRRVMKDVGHIPQIEDPNGFNAVLRAAIAEVVSAAARGGQN